MKSSDNTGISSSFAYVSGQRAILYKDADFMSSLILFGQQFPVKEDRVSIKEGWELRRFFSYELIY
ncbi:MAG: hypothetical protein A2277_19380 [Desulfobacterales bacterium RIFOXYA12_FULL_46_15]|nr:MAG: hypothetical protein A2277_19380 [Desulfobacterales bacterium RIFOXYA12_FULL_46_15]